MPYVNIKVTREGVTDAQKAALIKGVTDLLSQVLNKPSVLTHVVIDEIELANWGVGGLPAPGFRRQSMETDRSTLPSR